MHDPHGYNRNAECMFVYGTVAEQVTNDGKKIFLHLCLL